MRQRTQAIFKALISALLCLPLMLPLACGGDGGGSNITYPPTPPATVGGQRPAQVVAPTDYDPGQAYPLVVLLHGYGVTSFLQDALLAMKPRVDEKQFILIMPEGTADSTGRQFWNAGNECCDFDGKNVNDIGYISELIEEAMQAMHVDPERVTVTGHSNGGYMSYAMACNRSDLVRRIGVVAGLAEHNPEDCQDVEPVSVLHIHGTADETVPYPPGFLRVNGHELETVGAEASVGRWRERNGCPESPSSTAAVDIMRSLDGAESDGTVWQPCNEQTRVELWTINGGDHLLLGMNDNLREGLLDFLIE